VGPASVLESGISAVPSVTMSAKVLYSSLALSLLSREVLPSGLMTCWPSAHRIGHHVKTPQPPQLPPKKVPDTSPPSLATARAAAANSARVVGGLSGSRPASLNSFLLYIHTDRSITNGRPYFLPSQVEASMAPGAIASLNGSASIRDVRSWNSPADVQLGMNTTSPDRMSGRPLAAAAVLTLVL
jgi:hypothetical protein